MLTAQTGVWPGLSGLSAPGRAQASASCCGTERDPYRANKGFLASRSQVALGLSGATLRLHSSSRLKVTANPSTCSRVRSLGSRVKVMFQGYLKLGSRMLFTWKK